MEIGGTFASQPIGTPLQDNIFHWLDGYQAIYTDSGRSAIRLLFNILPKGPVLLPAYICASVYNCFPDRPLHFFRLTEDLRFDWDDLIRQLDNSAILYLHYFNGALPERNCLLQLRTEAERRGIPIVEDTTHSLFSSPLTIGNYGVCSLRKWFPIPDGGVLYGTHLPELPSLAQENAPRVQHIQQAMELKARYLKGLESESCNLLYRNIFAEGEQILGQQNTCYYLSSFAYTILNCYSVSALITARQQNYHALHYALEDILELQEISAPSGEDCPLVFSVALSQRDAARAYLTSEKIYCPIHWPIEGALLEYPNAVKFSHRELSLPIDQRYNNADMLRIADSLRRFKSLTMLKLIESKDTLNWDAEVKSFSNWDIYYLNGYARSLEKHEDGVSLLVTFSYQGERLCYPVIQKDIAKDSRFLGLLPENTWYDWETPYGYGGPLTDCIQLSLTAQKQFLKELTSYCIDHHIVSQFLRFHPMLENHITLSAVMDTRYMRDTIYIDTSSPDMILKNLDSKNRNMIRKAARSNVYCETHPIADYGPFLELYQKTMERNEADAYYFFDKSYFENLQHYLNAHASILYAFLDGRPISGAIFFHTNNMDHYHLSGSNPEFRGVAAGNLLLFEAALQAFEKGAKLLHLGGGISPNDNLFGFKKQFNKTGQREFWIGRNIFNIEKYQSLLKLRANQDCNFNPENHFMIQYRQ